MGRKINPIGMRIGINKTWPSRWYSDRPYRDYLLEDIRLRDHINEALKQSGIARIEIEHKAEMVHLIIWVARPGMVIGHRGRGVDQLRRALESMVDKEIRITVSEVTQPELEAPIAAQNIAQQIERRVSFRRAMRQGMVRSMQAGALGVKVICGGRLGGSELSRSEAMKDGKVPLHTLRADIDYGFAEAVTRQGRIGVKVWLYRGEIIPKADDHMMEAAQERRVPTRIVVDSTEVEQEAEESAATTDN